MFIQFLYMNSIKRIGDTKYHIKNNIFFYAKKNSS